MTVSEWLKNSDDLLRKKGIESARLDCLVLAEYATSKKRSNLLAHGDDILSEEQLMILNHALEKRAMRIPLAYITKKAWFYGREFYVDEHVLIPRPESEDLISLALELCPHAQQVADIGTGSGCLAITMALEFPRCHVTGVDVDPSALEVARKNAYAHSTKISFKESYLLNDIDLEFDLILANLPYVPDGLITSPEIEQEPEIALFSGKDGLDLYQSFWAQVGGKYSSLPGPIIITESLLNQHNDMVALATSANYHLVQTRGLAQAWQRNQP